MSAFDTSVYSNVIQVMTVEDLRVIASDSLALVALYDSTGGPNWTHNGNWLQGPVSTWHGVRVQNGRVTELHLDINNLQGMIPVELSDLSSLVYLELGGNQLSGAIPAEQIGRAHV